jgi:Bacterial membrane protein YfhO
MSFALYLIVAAAILFAWHRCVARVPRFAAIALILMPVLFTGPALLTNRAYGPYDLLYIVDPFKAYGPEYGAQPQIHNQTLLDLFMQHAPWQHQVRQSWSNGEWPLWNPTQFAGTVLLGNAQSAPFDPLNAIGYLLPLDLATTFGASITFFLAALFAYACAREFSLSERASSIAAAAFTFSSAMTFNVGWPLGRSWTMLPLALLAVRRVVRDRDLRAFVLLTIALALVILFGHPETALHVVTVGVAFGIYEMLPVRRKAIRPIAIAIAAGVVALALTAIYLLPVYTAIEAGAEKALRKASTNTAEWAAPPKELHRAIRATFIPYYGGASWRTKTSEFELGTARVGSIVLALAIVASILLFRNRDVRFLLVLSIITMLASWKAPPIGNALHALPLFDVTLNWRLGFVTALTLSLLAAFAFDALVERRRPAGWSGGVPPPPSMAPGRRPASRRDAGAPIIVALVGIALAVFTATLWQKQLALGVDKRLMIAGIAAELLGLALLVVAPRVPRVAFALILGALAAQRVVEDGNIYPAVPRDLFYRSVPLIDAIPRDPMYRTIGTHNLLIPNIATMYGLDDIRGYDSLRLGRYEDTLPLWGPHGVRGYRDVNDLSLPFLSFLAVKHAIAPSWMEPPAGWIMVKDDRGSRLMENTRVLPRVFVPRNIRYIDNKEAALAEMGQATDFAETAWIYTTDVAPHHAPNGAAQLHAKRIGTRYEVDVESAGGTRIVISEASWPGWRAYIDDRRVKIQLANHAFLSVGVPAGRHRVRLVYLPESFAQGRAITFATVLVLAIAGGLYSWRRKVS